MESRGCFERVVYYTRLADVPYPGIPDEKQGQVLTVIEGKNLHPAGRQVILWFESNLGGPSFQHFTVRCDQSDSDIYVTFLLYEDGTIEGISLSGSPEAYRLFQKAVWPE